MLSNFFIFWVNWTNGAIIMTIVFGLVIVGLIVAVLSMMNSKNNKKDSDTND
ncbi:MAG: hypothetical protein ACQESK_10535 [Bacteroidota bacterium]